MKKRCATLRDPRDIELIWFIQYQSWQPGGLDKFVAAVLEAFPGRFEVSKISEVDPMTAWLSAGRRTGNPEIMWRSCFITETSKNLIAFCLDPAFPVEQLGTIGDVCVFHDLHGALLKYIDQWEKKQLTDLVVTKVGSVVGESLDYAEEQRALALIEGNPRMGKTYMAKRWCEARPGKRRFVSLTEATSDKEFFREIALGVGSGSSYSYKATELRERVNDVLQAGYLTLVIDEAHYLFPQRNFREALPRRVNWVITALNNYNVPVALIATPQFTKSQLQIEKSTHWTSAQFIGRIGYCAKLPEHLEEKDLMAVARFHLPETKEHSIRVLVDYAVASQKHLAAIEQAVKAARRQARLKGRDTISHADVMVALEVTLAPSDAALNAVLNPAPAINPSAKKRGNKVSVTPFSEPSQPISSPIPNRNLGATSDRAKQSCKSLFPVDL
ncbi:MAG TPA: AAA family ATPase [Candidatus Methylacidiphilales bacterium]|nr:AAA family ATPase [Candidatus Methylacidiphilales bacterium]